MRRVRVLVGSVSVLLLGALAPPRDAAAQHLHPRLGAPRPAPAAAAAPVARADTLDYPWTGSGEYDADGLFETNSIKQLNLGALFLYNLLRNLQLGGGIGVGWIDPAGSGPTGESRTFYTVGVVGNGLFPLTGTRFTPYGGLTLTYSDETGEDTESQFEWGFQVGSKVRIKPDWLIDAGLFYTKLDVPDVVEDDYRLALDWMTRPVCFGHHPGAPRLELVRPWAEGRFEFNTRGSFEFKPNNAWDIALRGGYHLFEGFRVGADINYNRFDPEFGDTFTNTILAADANYFLRWGQGTGTLRPYGGVHVGSNMTNVEGADDVTFYGAQLGAQGFKSQNVAPFAEFQFRKYSEDRIPERWALNVGLRTYGY